MGDGAMIELQDPRAFEAKADLLELLHDTHISQEVVRFEGKPTKGRIDEAILAVERLNTNLEPVYSELLDGGWAVKYSGSYAPGLLAWPAPELSLLMYGGGFSLGSAISSFAEGLVGQALGFAVESKALRIDGGRDISASAEVRVAGMRRTLSYTAELMPLSAQRMSEEVISMDFPTPFGTRGLPFEMRRTILVTYLDDEVMIVRDESGVPEVLVRYSMSDESADAPLLDAADDASGGDIPSAEWYESGDEDPLSSGAA